MLSLKKRSKGYIPLLLHIASSYAVFCVRKGLRIILLVSLGAVYEERPVGLLGWLAETPLMLIYHLFFLSFFILGRREKNVLSQMVAARLKIIIFYRHFFVFLFATH